MRLISEILNIDYDVIDFDTRVKLFSEYMNKIRGENKQAVFWEYLHYIPGSGPGTYGNVNKPWFTKSAIISSNGKIISLIGEKIKVRKPYKCPIGHYRLLLTLGPGVVKRVLVHRAVGSTFIPKKEQDEEVNHKDGKEKDKLSDLDLEWCTKLENITHAKNTGLLNPSRGLKSTMTKPLLCKWEIQDKDFGKEFVIAGHSHWISEGFTGGSLGNAVNLTNLGKLPFGCSFKHIEPERVHHYHYGVPENLKPRIFNDSYTSPKSIPILVTIVNSDKHRGYQFVLDSSSDAKKYGFNQSYIGLVCKGKTKRSNLYKNCSFKYVTKNESLLFTNKPDLEILQQIGLSINKRLIYEQELSEILLGIYTSQDYRDKNLLILTEECLGERSIEFNYLSSQEYYYKLNFSIFNGTPKNRINVKIDKISFNGTESWTFTPNISVYHQQRFYEILAGLVARYLINIEDRESKEKYLNVTSAFNRGCGGSLSSEAAQVYDSFMGNMLQKYENLSGWLSETVESVKKAHNNFMSSKMWEFSNRIGRQGHYVGRFEIGYLSEVQFQQQATGFMRNYILANPTMMALYETEQISGYDGDFSDMCSGIGHGNYYYDKAMDGIVTQNENDEYFYRTYHTSLDEGTHLSPRERFDIQRTWRASDIHIKNLFDPSNIAGGNVLTLEEVEERRKEQETESN